MVSKAQARVRLGLDQKELQKGLKEAAKELGDWGTRINQSLELAKKAWGAITGAIGFAVGAIGKWTDAAREAEKIEAGFLAAVRRRQEFTEEQLKTLKASNAERQQALGLDGEEQLRIQTLLSGLKVKNERLDEATKLTIGLAEVTGSYDSAAKAVGKALNGNDAALRKLNLSLKDLHGLYDIAAAKGKTFDGRVKALTENWGDFEETLGAVITKSPAVVSFIDTLSKNVQTLTGFLEDEAGRRDVETFFKLMFDGAVLALSATTLLGKSLHGLANIGTFAELKSVESDIEEVQQKLQILRDQDAGVGPLMGSLALGAEDTHEALLERLNELTNEHERLSKRATEGTFHDIEQLSKRLQQQFLLAKSLLGEPGTGKTGKTGRGGGGGDAETLPEAGGKGRLSAEALAFLKEGEELGKIELRNLKAREKLAKEALAFLKEAKDEERRIELQSWEEKQRLQTQIAEENNEWHAENLRLAKQYNADLAKLEQASSQQERDRFVESAAKRQQVIVDTTNTTAGVLSQAASTVISGIATAGEQSVKEVVHSISTALAWQFGLQALAWSIEATAQTILAAYGYSSWDKVAALWVTAGIYSGAAATFGVTSALTKGRGSAGGARGGAGGGAGTGVGGLPSATRPTSERASEQAPAIIYNINVGIAGGDGKRVAQDIRRVLREGGAVVPSRRRAA